MPTSATINRYLAQSRETERILRTLYYCVCLFGTIDNRCSRFERHQPTERHLAPLAIWCSDVPTALFRKADISFAF